MIISDADQNLANAAQLIHVGAARDGGDTNMPTTILVDPQGVVRWIYRPDSIVSRLPPEVLLKAIEQHLEFR